jgi:DNA polymerase-3 subunit epsilon
MYAIVDIETTGGNAVSNRIIEVAVYIHDGSKVIDSYETLVHPGRPIPSYISALTGIDDETVTGAPYFDEIAPKLYEMLQDKVFIAHNVNFDFSFIKKEFDLLGMNFNNKRLCTVRLSKKLIPGMNSYSLGKLCAQVGIKINNRHRAAGDAQATVKLFELLKSKDTNDFIGLSLKKTSREALLPPNLPREDFEQLPAKPGVYYFHDQKGKVIYVGKAIDLKKRVASHFTGNSETRRKGMMVSSIHRISYQLCGNELLALLYEAHEIKRLWPEYNHAQKKISAVYGIYRYEDRNGYQRMGVNRVQKMQQPLKTFRLLSEARNYIESKSIEYSLCPKLCGLHVSNEACFDYPHRCDGACVKEVEADEYNLRFEMAVDSFIDPESTFAIIGKGRELHERSVVLVEKGQYRGFTYMHKDKEINDIEELKNSLSGYTDTIDTLKLIDTYLATEPADEIFVFE